MSFQTVQIKLKARHKTVISIRSYPVVWHVFGYATKQMQQLSLTILYVQHQKKIMCQIQQQKKDINF